MAPKAQLTIDMDATLAAEFAAATRSARTSETEVLRAMVRDYVERQNVPEAYRSFVETKVERGRADVTAGITQSAEDVEREFLQLRNRLIDTGQQ
ncbi:hypothetical protein [Rhizobium sp. SGZ-381]|uniref:hypothetical protein n=1 Tax=Rhizobium sp. SGZ-381 TaxID=3342800 RepID=UPI00366CF53A